VQERAGRERASTGFVVDSSPVVIDVLGMLYVDVLRFNSGNPPLLPLRADVARKPG